MISSANATDTTSGVQTASSGVEADARILSPPRALAASATRTTAPATPAMIEAAAGRAGRQPPATATAIKAAAKPTAPGVETAACVPPTAERKATAPSNPAPTSQGSAAGPGRGLVDEEITPTAG